VSEDESAPTGYKLLLVPESDIAATASDDPSQVYLSLTGPAYEAVADVGEDRRFRKSPWLHGQVEALSAEVAAEARSLFCTVCWLTDPTGADPAVMVINGLSVCCSHAHATQVADLPAWVRDLIRGRTGSGERA
jgi:hypothetical protein